MEWWGRIAIDSETQRLSDKLSSKLSHHPNFLLHGSDHRTYKTINFIDDIGLLGYRDHIRSMVKVFLELHKVHKISVLRLDPSNIVTDDDGNLKFRDLVFINTSPESQMNDFRLLASAIEQKNSTWPMISKPFPIPKDLQDLLSIMYNYRASDGDLLLNHLALQSSSVQLDSETQRLSDKLSSKLSHHPNFLLHGSDHRTYKTINFIDDIFELDICNRDHIRSMVKVFLELHKDHKISVLRLDPSNIVTDDDGNLKFCDLVFINTSPESQMNDFRLLARAIENMIKVSNPMLNLIPFSIRIPQDLQDLLSIMYNYRASDGDLLLNHLALQSSSVQLGFIRNAFEKRKFLIELEDKVIYKKAIQGMHRSAKNKKDWRLRIINSSFTALKECYEHKPESKAVDYQNTKYSILQFCRNLATHLPENLRKFHEWDGTESETYSVIMEHFGEELLSFQYWAHEYGILKDLMPGYTSSTSARQIQYYSGPDVGGWEHHRTPDLSRGRSGTVAPRPK